MSGSLAWQKSCSTNFAENRKVFVNIKLWLVLDPFSWEIVFIGRGLHGFAELRKSTASFELDKCPIPRARCSGSWRLIEIMGGILEVIKGNGPPHAPFLVAIREI